MVELDEVPGLQRDKGQQTHLDAVAIDQRAGFPRIQQFSAAEIDINNGELDFAGLLPVLGGTLFIVRMFHRALVLSFSDIFSGSASLPGVFLS